MLFCFLSNPGVMHLLVPSRAAMMRRRTHMTFPKMTASLCENGAETSSLLFIFIKRTGHCFCLFRNAHVYRCGFLPMSMSERVLARTSVLQSARTRKRMLYSDNNRFPYASVLPFTYVCQYARVRLCIEMCIHTCNCP